MRQSIRTQIIEIDNSHVIRIPKSLLEQSGLDADVEIEAQYGQLIIRKAPKLREGWDEAFATMARNKDDILLNNVTATEWEQTEWQW